MKKVLAAVLTLCLCVNISFAFDPYADEEIEKKSYKKLYYGIALTLLGGFLAYDGFSQEEVDVSKPSVEYATVLHSEWSQYPIGDNKYFSEKTYGIKSGYSDFDYVYYGNKYSVEQNILYNNGNVDLENITIEVRYRYGNEGKNAVIEDDGWRNKNGIQTSDNYHVATIDDGISRTEYINFSLKKGENIKWSDVWGYCSTYASQPNGRERGEDSSGENLTGLNLGENALNLMDVRVVMKKNQQYKPIYEKRNKSDIEGVCGIMVGIVGIYFIIDHFLDMHKFNVYAKRHNLNLKIATAPSEYKLMIQKRI